MLDNILNSLRRGGARVQRRGEEVAHAARLRLEVYQLGRELDALYARLGRSFHAGADVQTLGGVREDIVRVEEEIRARERLIEELGRDEDVGNPVTTAAPVQTTVPPRPQPTTASPEVSPMTKDDAQRSTPTTPDPTEQRSDDLLTPGKDTASMGNEAGRDAERRDNTREQAENMKGHDDPLANK